ncbi:MAG: HigA family addiction module antitoxin [Pseudomonadota bacterium]
MSASRTITEGNDRLDTIHPGEILREEFLIGSDIPTEKVAREAGINQAKLQRLLDEEIAVDADLDLRLGRYFAMSPGFFLRLQNHFDLEEFRREHGDELDKITEYAE